MRAFIIAAITADGFIARNAGQNSFEWTSPEDKRFFVEKSKAARVVIMGAATARTIGKPLPGRLNIVYTDQPEEFPGWEATTMSPADLLGELAERGYEEAAVCGGASVYTQFMQAGVVGKLYLTVESWVFGAGVPLFSGAVDKRLELDSAERLGDRTVLLEYSVR